MLSYFYICCIFISAALCILTGCIINWNKKAVKEFIVTLILIITAISFYAACLVINDFKTKVFVHELKFIGVAFFSVGFYVMYMRFFDRTKETSRKRILLMCIVPAIAVLLAVTNNYHHLFRRNVYPVINEWGSFVGVESGPLYYVYIVYCYFIYFYGIYIISANYFKTPKIYRQQIGVMFFASVITMVVNIFSVFGIFIDDFGDATLLFFVISAAMQYFGMVVFKPKKMITSARNMAVNEIKAPILIFDYRDEFLDANIAARETFCLWDEETLDGFMKRHGLENVFTNPENEVVYEKNEDYFFVSGKKLYTNGEFIGSVITFNNITEIKTQETILKDLAHNDYLTKLPNRHAYLNRLAQAIENDLPVAIVFINISRMKTINNLYGSRYGDTVIKKVSEALVETADKKIFCARVYGDEFVMLLYKTNEDGAKEKIHLITEKLKDASIDISYGFAVKQFSMENIHITARTALENLYNNKFKRTLE